MNNVEIEIEKNKFLNIGEDKAIELAVNEYFKSGKSLNINGRPFDIMSYGGDYRAKLQLQ